MNPTQKTTTIHSVKNINFDQCLISKISNLARIWSQEFQFGSEFEVKNFNFSFSYCLNCLFYLIAKPNSEEFSSFTHTKFGKFWKPKKLKFYLWKRTTHIYVTIANIIFKQLTIWQKYCEIWFWTPKNYRIFGDIFQAVDSIELHNAGGV